jgi:8-oxo-dGTP pyrophosphatase MutT (NUDIX family)
MRATLIHTRTVELDIGELRRRFARPRRIAESLGGDHGIDSDEAALRPASVLIPIIARTEELTVLFTRRTTHLRDHSGQISFPGGRAEPQDPSPESTALRETEEEIGIDPGRIEVAGRLAEYRTGTGYRITPVVGFVTPPFELKPDAYEVDEVFEVPFSFLLDPRHHLLQSREIRGEMRSFFAIPYERHYIWGATAGLLVNLYRHLVEYEADFPE